MRALVPAAAGGLLFMLAACGTLEISVDGTPTADVATTGTVGALQTQYAELATRVAAAPPAVGTTPEPTIAPGEVATVAVPPATRITFLNGASVGVVSAPIAPDERQAYVLDAFKNQPMFVYVASANNDVTVSIEADDGTVILRPSEQKISWQGTLPNTGDYYLTVHGGAYIENFTLTVTVPWRLQFATGEDSITLGGKTTAGYSVSYTVYAIKGQTMKVHLDQMSSKASLSVYGFTDGNRYLSSDAGQRGYQFLLPATQDYIVVVVPFAGSSIDYILTVQIR